MHLVRLNYRHLSLKDATWDVETKIFPDHLLTAIVQTNPNIDGDDINLLLTDIKLLLDNEDLGKAFIGDISSL